MHDAQVVSAGEGADSITSRYFTPRRCHASHAVTGAIGVSAAYALPGTVASSALALEGPRSVAVLHPQKRVYRVQSTPTTEAAIQPGITRDLYVSLGEAVKPNTWTLRIHVKPFVDWIWGGCLLMALGGILAVSDRRYRQKARQAEAPLLPARPPVPVVGPLGASGESA